MTAERQRARVACVGVYILDVLGRAIDELPTVQRTLIIDEIRLTAAGSAGGTAVDLARMGADVLAVGAIGSDHAGDFVVKLLHEEGVDVAHLARRYDSQTATTMLAISSQGLRPGWHAVGANATLGPDDLPLDALERCDALHYGGVSALPGLDGEPARELLERVHGSGVLTTADCLGVKRPDAMELLAPALPSIDVFLPNRDEAMMLTGRDDPREAARALQALSGNWVAVTLDAEGCFAVGEGEELAVPAFAGPIVDTTGCGDAVSAGVITGLLAGRSMRDALTLGMAGAALTAAGLGSDAGIRSFEETVAFMENGRHALG
jgi:sugar/nucleoside kinase (ribokinase family)